MVWVAAGLVAFLVWSGLFIVGMCRIGANADRLAEEQYRLLEEGAEGDVTSDRAASSKTRHPDDAAVANSVQQTY
jgi:hypothetical protein